MFLLTFTFLFHFLPRLPSIIFSCCPSLCYYVSLPLCLSVSLSLCLSVSLCLLLYALFLSISMSLLISLSHCLSLSCNLSFSLCISIALSLPNCLYPKYSSSLADVFNERKLMWRIVLTDYSLQIFNEISMQIFIGNNLLKETAKHPQTFAI